VYIHYRGNDSSEPLPRNDKENFTEPLPSNDKGIHTASFLLFLAYFSYFEKIKVGL
jgi:hypothetical protein